ncbi:MAG: hypothetical protein MJ134_10165 [Lachnospiraceae bacterium]|nr:hypothetical protein [Lachnospiraceae bacterium]
MSYTTKPFQELSLIDDFLSNAISSNKDVNEDFYKTLIPALLQRDINLEKIHIRNQYAIQGNTPYYRGIRLDVEISDNPELEFIKNVFDIEPHTRNDSHFPRQNRYYQAKIDSKLMKAGEDDFSKLPNLFVMMITNFDIFHEEYMLYTFRNQCIEVPSVPYDDGLVFMYFNTKGTKGGSQALKNVLTYYQDSQECNAVDDITRKLHTYVSQVKNPELEDYYMTLGQRIDRDNAILIKETTERVTADVTEKNMYIFLEFLLEENKTKDEALAIMSKKYPQFEDKYTAFINEHWKNA